MLKLKNIEESIRQLEIQMADLEGRMSKMDPSSDKYREYEKSLSNLADIHAKKVSTRNAILNGVVPSWVIGGLSVAAPLGLGLLIIRRERSDDMVLGSGATSLMGRLPFNK